ncbi:hypothetical protein Bpfe_004502 [Biomphalaria pfeifferi]|uniref:Uncharacterized protein n=1 Tax=Biomphalaria pfeifferi TaxID=112525 RepID=A0AAD8FK29_BIOPF|nr:hypothetical protein Bpfe_004502 [Biomphalaria pfeifferi]
MTNSSQTSLHQIHAHMNPRHRDPSSRELKREVTVTRNRIQDARRVQCYRHRNSSAFLGLVGVGAMGQRRKTQLESYAPEGVKNKGLTRH